MMSCGFARSLLTNRGVTTLCIHFRTAIIIIIIIITSEFNLRPSLTHSTERGRPLRVALFEPLALHTSWIFPPRTTVSVPVTCTVTSGQPTTTQRLTITDALWHSFVIQLITKYILQRFDTVGSATVGTSGHNNSQKITFEDPPNLE